MTSKRSGASPYRSHRHLALVGVLAVVSSAAGPIAAAAQQVAVDQPASPDIPRTPDGRPDLQGNWSNATLTPLTRPEGRGPVLTWEEAAAIELGQAQLVEQNAQASDPDRPPPEAGGTYTVCIDSATGCYNEVYRQPGDRVAVVNGEPRSSLITFPADGQVPPVTEEARRKVQEDRAFRAQFGQYDHPELRPLGERCILSFGSSAGPPMLPNYWYNNNYTIVQTPDHVLIMAEMVHDARIIRMGDGPRLPPHIRPWLGESWGRWEGDTLVVETTGFHPEQRYRGYASDQLKVTERFTLQDAETILYEFTIDDPSTYAEPWGGQVPFRKMTDLLYEYACHEGNYAMGNILSGARYQERMEAQGAPDAQGGTAP
jgi:hypothetical protein